MDLLSGGLSAIGGLVSNIWTDKRQDDAQKFAAQQAQNQMDFQERMSNSAYQRSMADMKAGGLNPILAYQRGPASSPTGAMASTSYTPATDIITPAVSSAQHGKRLNYEVENMMATNANLKETNANLQAQRVQIGSQVANINADTRIKLEALSAAQKGADVAEIDKKFYEHPIGQGSRYLGQLFRELNPFGSGGRSLPPISIRPHGGGWQ